MIEIAVKYIERVTGAQPYTGNANRMCRGCVIDSRLVETDNIFVAFSGERVDGNEFAPQAIEAGAAAVILTKEPSRKLIRLADDHECAVFVTTDAEQFLLDLAQGYRSRMHCTVVGITGSIGKTTTKDILTELLSVRYRVHATQGNYNNLIGMPLTILSAPKDTQVLVLEMGMNSFGEIERLSTCAQPTYSVITKIGTSHIGMLGSRENIARAKAEILVGMPPSAENFEGRHSVLVLGGEDDYTPFIIDTFARPAGVDVLLAGTSEDDDVCARNIEVGADGCPEFDITLENGSQYHTGLSIPGAQSVQNALYAAAIASRMGIAQYEIDQVIHKLAITGRRQELRHAASGATVIDDSYNASPESMAAALDLLTRLDCAGSRIAILGEIGELGDDAARLHALVGAYAAAKKLDLMVCVGGDGAAEMARDAKLMGMPEQNISHMATTEQALARWGSVLAPTDLVLVKGSRFVGLDRFVEGVCADVRK